MTTPTAIPTSPPTQSTDDHSSESEDESQARDRTETPASSLASRIDDDNANEGASDEEWEDESEDDEPKYSPAELAEIFLDFYTFLTTLHFAPSDLKVPPPEGWPMLNQERCEGWKSDFALEVVRHLPFLNSEAQMEYKCCLLDYTELPDEHFKEGDFNEELMAQYWEDDGKDAASIFAIAHGYESGGVTLYLDVHNGEILEDIVRMNPGETADVKEYFDVLKEKYRSLKLIPCLGRIVMDAERTEERESEITEEEFHEHLEGKARQYDDIYIQYIRQMYRRLGWPDAFRREEAYKAVNELMDSMEEKYGWQCTWEKSDC
ncbi:hypothetical protein K461DRAFT_289901 [Myriangium duriaei CBS 260.36]|uniref:Uncharacterized protein n=1 Tax=Myriangium duriaei CBS 260.36 TaxID=1168546 RepID=A0A9P4J9S9_9PEZI|nr:hypothetical protein K461DRAFT_289901 [Myriangium duriaei CBS 260.36]